MNCVFKVTTTQHQSQGGLMVSKRNCRIKYSSNTVIEHSCKASLIISELFNVLERLFVFYTDSMKRMSSLLDSIKALEVENPLNLRNLSKTRWTARAELIKSVWSGYEAILDSLEKLEESGDANASGLHSKLLRFDFIVSIMFMKNVMYKTKQMTETLQSEDINVMDAITIIESTVKSLETINNDIDGMNAEIKAVNYLLKKLGTDVESDFRRYHHARKPPRQIDDNPNATANLSVESYYRKEFKAVLDTQITTFADAVDKCSITIKPLFQTLGIGREPSSVPNFEDLAKLHPDRPDPDTLMCEMEIFKIHCVSTKSNF